MRNLRLLSVFVFTISFNYFFSQTTFLRAYGSPSNDGASTLCQTFDGGYLIAGSSDGFANGGSLLLLRLNASGDTLWSRGYDENNTLCARSIYQTPDSGFIVAGCYGVLKTDKDGNIIWENLYGVPIQSLRLTSDGGYVIAGGFGSFNLDAYMLKVDAQGNKQCCKKIAGTQTQSFSSVIETKHHSYVAMGLTNSWGAGSMDLFLVKFDSSGNLLFARTYGGAGAEQPLGRASLQETSDGGYIMGAMSTSFGNSNGDAYVVKTDSMGNVNWSKVYRGPNGGWISAVKEIKNQGYIFAGTNSDFIGHSKGFLIKTDLSGDTLWTRAFGDSASNGSADLQISADHGYGIVGSSNSLGAGMNDVLFLKTDSAGSFSCRQSRIPTTVQNVVSQVTNTAPNVIYLTLNVSSSISPVYSNGLIVTDPCAINNVDEQLRDEAIRIYPNPASQSIKISVPPKEMNGIITITDILGKEILRTSFRQQVDVSALEDGVYYLKLMGARSRSFKIVVRH